MEEQKVKMCDATLRQLSSELEERLKVLESREQTSITLGRIGEVQLFMLQINNYILDNLDSK